MSEAQTQGIPRLHEMDALRASAMFLGIVLHCSLAYTGEPWVVQDPNRNQMFGMVNSFIHGFRMPLFMMISGFFTMMLWRRKGLKALLGQRFQRVLVPCMLGLITIVPLLHVVSTWAVETAARQEEQKRSAPGGSTEVVEAVKKKESAELERVLAGGADPNQVDAEYGVPALIWASLIGDASNVKILLDHGARVDISEREGYGALHSAAFLGRAEVADLLLERGADPQVRGPRGDRPMESTHAPWGMTRMIAGALKIPLPDRDELEASRAQCRQRIAQSTGETVVAETKPSALGSALESMREGYASFLSSDRFLIHWGRKGETFHLILGSLFDHLWFLWFLCWLVAAFALCAWRVDNGSPPVVPNRLVLSPFRFLWLLPLTMIPQLFMGAIVPGFGPDTSAGLLPQPHLLLYYGIFFGFGALYFDSNDQQGRLGRYWYVLIPVAIVSWLTGLVTIGQTIPTGLAQIVFAWAMIFALIGLARRYLRQENRTIRYLSDSAYWLYLAHLPLVILLQGWVRPWELPALIKFLLIFTLATGFLLFTYETMVRYTWIGWLLNGRRTRHPTALGSPSASPRGL